MMKKSIFLLLWVALLTVCFPGALRAQSTNDDQILVEGDFTPPPGQVRNYLGRLSMDSATIQDLRAITNSVVWERSGVRLGTLTNGANSTFTGTETALVVASQVGNANRNPTLNVMNTFAMTASMVTSTCILDHNTRPTNWDYSQVGGRRGLINSPSITQANETIYRCVMKTNETSFGMWYSIGHSLDDKIAYDPKAMFHPMIKTNYQAQLMGVDMVVTDCNSPAGQSNLELRMEIKGFDHGQNQQVWQSTKLDRQKFPDERPLPEDELRRCGLLHGLERCRHRLGSRPLYESGRHRGG